MSKHLKEVKVSAMEVSGRKSIPGRRNSICKGPEVAVCLRFKQQGVEWGKWEGMRLG